MCMDKRTANDLTSNRHEIHRLLQRVDQDTDKRDELRQAFQISFKQGDHSDALQCWNKMKESETPPPVPVAKVVKSMQRHQMDTPVILHELMAYFERYPSEFNEGVVRDVVAPLVNRIGVDVAEDIMDVLPLWLVTQTKSSRMYEILLSVRTTRPSHDFIYQKWLIALEMSESKEALRRSRELRFAFQNSK